MTLIERLCDSDILKIVLRMKNADQGQPVFIELTHKESILNKRHILLA